MVHHGIFNFESAGALPIAKKPAASGGFFDFSGKGMYGQKNQALMSAEGLGTNPLTIILIISAMLLVVGGVSYLITGGSSGPAAKRRELERRKRAMRARARK